MAAALVLAVAPAAMAKTGDTTLKCNGDQKFVTTIVRTGKGQNKVKQVDAEYNKRTDWKGVSANGNSIGWKYTSEGDTVTWSGVLASTYSIYGRAHVPTDCADRNPFSTGDYNVKWSVTAP